MPQVSETIPESLRPRVDAAVAWFNSTDEAAGDEFAVTGILDADQSIADGAGEIRLILCGGDRCEQHSFRFSGSADSPEINFASGLSINPLEKIQAELDPPPGARLRWLDNALAKHNFVVLVFYRGFW